MSIFICAPKSIEQVINIIHCPTCDGDQKFMCEFYEWYGWSQTCLNCGERWNDGEREERPFMPAWRKKSIEEATKRARYFGLITDEESEPCK